LLFGTIGRIIVLTKGGKTMLRFYCDQCDEELQDEKFNLCEGCSCDLEQYEVMLDRMEEGE